MTVKAAIAAMLQACYSGLFVVRCSGAWLV